MDQVDDISSLIDYYDKNRKASKNVEVGQIVFTPVTFSDKRPHIFDINRESSISHNSAKHTIRLLNEKMDFKKKADRLPIHALSLGETEELFALKAKMRPCLVLAKIDGIDISSLPEGPQKNKALNAFNENYLLAPIYSVSNGFKTTMFGPIMTARIKCMMYPEFVYAPAYKDVFKEPGVIRLDRMFWGHMIGCSEPIDAFLSKEMMGICWSQISVIAGQASAEEYAELRGLLLEFLPDSCK